MRCGQRTRANGLLPALVAVAAIEGVDHHVVADDVDHYAGNGDPDHTCAEDASVPDPASCAAAVASGFNIECPERSAVRVRPPAHVQAAAIDRRLAQLTLEGTIPGN